LPGRFFPASLHLALGVVKLARLADELCLRRLRLGKFLVALLQDVAEFGEFFRLLLQGVAEHELSLLRLLGGDAGTLCLDETGALPGGDWIGQGSATCQQTMGCLQGAAGNLGSITDCVLASKPDVSVELSAALRCFMTATDPASQCGAQIQACGAK
jgi:hypothetical protein